MPYGLFKMEDHRKHCMCGDCKNTSKKFVRVSDRMYSTFNTAAFVFASRIIEAKGNLFIRYTSRVR